MGTAFGSIRIQLNADSSKLRKGVDESVGVLKGLRSQLGLINTAIGGLVGLKIFQGIGGAMFSAAKASSDLNESINAAGATFGPFSETVVSAAEEMASKFGVVRSEFIGAATGLGAIFKASGLAADEAARMSVQFSKLAADVSSLRNISFEEALDKIRSGLVGEAEPLRTLGVLLDEDTVKREAVAKGIAKQNEELSQTQKVMARASIIARQLADANGDLEKTAGEFANSLRAAQGRLTNFAADVGSAFDDVSKYLTVGIGRGIAALTEGIKDQRKAWQDWSAAAVAEGGVINQAIGAIGVGVGKLIGLFRVWVKVIAAVSMGVVGLGLGFEKLGILTTIDKNSSIEDFAKAFAKSANDLDKALEGAEQGAVKFFDEFRKGAGQAAEAAKQVRDEVRRIEWRPAGADAGLVGAMDAGALLGGGAAAGAQGAAALTFAGEAIAKALEKTSVLRRDGGDLFAGAAARGSAEARSAILEARGRANPQKKVEENTRNTVRQLEQANQSLAAIASGVAGAAGEFVL